MPSAITGNYIIFGLCGTYSKEPNNNKSWIGNNQVQVSRSTQENEEVWTPIMEEITIKDVSSIEVLQDSD